MASPGNRLGASPPSGSASAAILLNRQFKQMQTDKDIPGISCGLVGDSVFEWEIMIMLDEEQDGLYGGGCFKGNMSFPPTYPHAPPRLKFQTPLFHPNVFENGEVCISILHPPGDDKYGYESAAERWSPVQTPETILLSVISMLGSPNDESPANIEAGKLWREDKKEFKKKVRKCVRDSQENAWD
ncbi:Ubiquitin-conjugating enzyme E2 15 [Recurvomyces mirabilis]|uniref:Ubiquitin-conjugating enzyme E2 2 n=1 Tax=Recurvomyces mirabilis TaxID=574656 RepID=A0AAE0WK61_9PEZI|nr:Ubiquitin-conjugating enzyme E2 15 [Recurvomyces mirabilis]KAK5153239.1 Ubiquitin-conjugating enzyme E2 15 [Recurvomyces mirabilis]